MTFFEDLTPYQYFVRQEPPGLAPLNVGWLSRGQPFVTGESSQEFKEKLFKFCLDIYVVHIARGFHACEFCNLSDERWYEESASRFGEKSHWMSIGDGEIRVVGESAIYAAPTLLYHYVVEHHYRPPDEFIEAVIRGPAPGSEEHEALLAKYQHV